ncbi:MAG: hypothetical protein R6U27_02415 [Desulfobacterales bacterium]
MVNMLRVDILRPQLFFKLNGHDRRTADVEFMGCKFVLNVFFHVFFSDPSERGDADAPGNHNYRPFAAEYAHGKDTIGAVKISLFAGLYGLTCFRITQASLF